VRNHFKHSGGLVDREIDVVDALAAVADFLLTGPPTGREPAMVQGNERG
jgi:hypothetical protein